MKLLLAGDVMTGRGIDQILAAPCDPAIDEPWVKSAADYVRLAERASGPIPRRAGPQYIWGDALGELERHAPAARIVNLETAVTMSEARLPKGINYRMSPANASCLAAARIDCCTLANNHVLDWGAAGLVETLETLRALGMRGCGAGRDDAQAAAPAILETPGAHRVLVFAYGMASAGVPRDWAAAPARAGVNWLDELSGTSIERVSGHIRAARRAGDVVVVSIHWDGNWGYELPEGGRSFARRLIDAGAADLVHGHSSHHPRGLEIYRGKLILYGCGDLINDYEGIAGHEAFRPQLALLYFAELDPAGGRLRALEMSALRVRRFRLQRASDEEAQWLAALLARESGMAFAQSGQACLRLQ